MHEVANIMEKKQQKSKGDPALGKRVRKIREDRGLKQAELAGMVSISASCITRLERGESMVSVFTLREIAQALEVPASWIMDYNEPNSLYHWQALQVFRLGYYCSEQHLHERLNLYLLQA